MADKQNVDRIDPKSAKADIESGEAIMVCSYSDDHCKDMLAKGAVLKSEFESRLQELPKSREIIFYCN